MAYRTNVLGLGISKKSASYLGAFAPCLYGSEKHSGSIEIWLLPGSLQALRLSALLVTNIDLQLRN